MPTGPEFGNVFGKERLPEIFGYPDTEYFTDTYYNVHCAGEFHIKHDGIPYHAYRNRCTAEALIVIKNVVYKKIQPVGDDKLFKKAVKYALIAETEIAVFYLFAAVKRLRGIGISDDRAFHNLREK